MRILAFVVSFPFLTAGFVQATPIADIDIIGTTLGCFGAGCTPVANASLGGLTFLGGSFSGETDSGGEFAAGVAGDNFGLFTLAGTAFNYGSFATPTPFTLRLLMTAPSPGNTPVGIDFSGQVSGVVNSATNGTVSITWPGICHGCGGPPVFLYDFVAPEGSGMISVHVNPLSFSLSKGSKAPQTAIQDGHFHTDAAIVPEPGTFALISGALAGLLALRRFRR